MTLRSVRLLDALNTAEVTYRAWVGPSEDDSEGTILGSLSDVIMNMYGLHDSRGIILDVITGKVPAVRAVKAIKAITAMYEEEA